MKEFTARRGIVNCKGEFSWEAKEFDSYDEAKAFMAGYSAQSLSFNRPIPIESLMKSG